MEDREEYDIMEMNETEEIRILEIKKVIEEAEGTKTFIFNYSLGAEPGQFIIVWIPEINEKPFSVCYQEDERFGITVFGVGEFSKAMNRLKEGDKVGMRGPYGKGFSVKRCNAVLVGGGYGSAPMAFLSNELKKQGSAVDLIIGAKTKELVLYEERMNAGGINYHPCTDDGSHGFKGFTTELLERILQFNKKINMVYTCGPEIMMKKVIAICDKYEIQCEVSVERYMKCGFGICGQCCIDNTGARTCKEGPVFSKQEVEKIFEFNKYHRTGSGQKKVFGEEK